MGESLIHKLFMPLLVQTSPTNYHSTVQILLWKRPKTDITSEIALGKI